MNGNLSKTAELGQSVWCDFISLSMIGDGTLDQMIEEGVRGVTSNPAIFQKAIAGSCDYDSLIAKLAGQGASDGEIYDSLTIGDVGAAADKFLSLWKSTEGLDGYVSLEVSPLIAGDCATTLSEAKRLWMALNRPNVMIKIPATEAGIPAIEEAIAAGINVNVTLIFSVEQYAAAAEAYIRGLERRVSAGLGISNIASVASVFVSRIDSAVDPQLAEKGAGDMAGHIAIDNARMTYQKFLELFSGARWQKLASLGARVQRPLWASTGVKNPAYSPVLYVDELIGPDTVNTVPPATMEQFMNIGNPASRVCADIEGAKTRLSRLTELGIDLNATTDDLLEKGLKAFVDSFEILMASIAAKRAQLSR